jgi:hypothetical protein
VFRIGLHLGKLIVEGDDLYGDGMNEAFGRPQRVFRVILTVDDCVCAPSQGVVRCVALARKRQASLSQHLKMSSCWRRSLAVC